MVSAIVPDWTGILVAGALALVSLNKKEKIIYFCTQCMRPLTDGNLKYRQPNRVNVVSASFIYGREVTAVFNSPSTLFINASDLNYTISLKYYLVYFNVDRKPYLYITVRFVLFIFNQTEFRS